MDAIESIQRRFVALSPHPDEKSLRLLAASETLPLGRRSMSLVSAAAAAASSPICRGLAELGEEPGPSGRVRRHGGGRKPAGEVQYGLGEARIALVEPVVGGDPERPLRWVSKSPRRLAAALSEQGISASHALAGRLPKQQGCTPQGNVKTGEGAQHPDQDAQFRHISDQVAAFAEAGQPVISVDARKKLDRIAEAAVADHPGSTRQYVFVGRNGTKQRLFDLDFTDASPPLHHRVAMLHGQSGQEASPSGTVRRSVSIIIHAESPSDARESGALRDLAAGHSADRARIPACRR